TRQPRPANQLAISGGSLGSITFEENQHEPCWVRRSNLPSSARAGLSFAQPPPERADRRNFLRPSSLLPRTIATNARRCRVPGCRAAGRVKPDENRSFGS